MKRLAIALAAAAIIGTAVPASAQGVYVGVGDPYYGGWGMNWGTWSGGYGGYWGGPAYASWGWSPGYAYGWGPGYRAGFAGPAYAYASTDVTYTTARPRARRVVVTERPRVRSPRVVYQDFGDAYAYAGFGPRRVYRDFDYDYGYVGFGPRRWWP
jgi:hypothetical protein